MIQIAHLLDDFGMGGVTRALTLFDEPALKRIAQSQIVSVNPSARLAPSLKADLIVDHMSLSWARLAFLASLRARNPRARIVHVEHSYTRAFEANMVASPKRFRSMLRLASLLFDETVCVSKAQRNWLSSEVGIPNAKLSVIYPWTDRGELFNVEGASSKKQRPLQLLAYGRFAAVKNFDALIEAMRAIDPEEAQLTLFGDGPDREALAARAADLPHVEVRGPCSEPGSYLSDCDAVILPSTYEAFGLVATEARMAGRAVIVADVDGLPEQAVEGGMVMTMTSAKQIEAAIRSAMTRDLASLGKAARAGVRDQNAAILDGWIRLIGSTCRASEDASEHRMAEPTGRAAS